MHGTRVTSPNVGKDFIQDDSKIMKSDFAVVRVILIRLKWLSFDIRLMDFQTTQWTRIIHSANSSTPEGAAALEKLCRDYWPPLFEYVRSFGVPHADAEDLTQSFFSKLLTSGLQAQADRERGRFRTFLLTAVKRFMMNEHRRDTRQKRGGPDREEITLDAIPEPPGADDSPDRAFDRKWAHTLLAHVMDHLRLECESSGHGTRFAVLSPMIFGSSRGDGAEETDAEKLGLSVASTRVALSRLRQRYRDLLRAEVACLVDSPDEVDDELTHLMLALS